MATEDGKWKTLTGFAGPDLLRYWVGLGADCVSDIARSWSSAKEAEDAAKEAQLPAEALARAGPAWERARNLAKMPTRAARLNAHPGEHRSDSTRGPTAPAPADVVEARANLGLPAGYRNPHRSKKRDLRGEIVPAPADGTKVEDARAEALLQMIYNLYLAIGPEGDKWVEVTGEDNFRRSLILRPFRHKIQAVASKWSVWTRWKRWWSKCVREGPLHKPKPMLLAIFLEEVALGGPTAAESVLSALKWWHKHLGVPMPVRHTLLSAFAVHDDNHAADQGEQIHLWIVANLILLVKRGQGAVSQFASLILIVIGICLRWRHAQRSQLQGVSDRFLKGRCTKGKRRVKGAQPPFEWASPRQWLPGEDTSALAISVLLKMAHRMGPAYEAAPFLIPDITVDKGGFIEYDSQWLDKPMQSSKFNRLFRQLLQKMGAPAEIANRLSAKCLRKVLPTIAGLLLVPAEAADSLGNWQDKSNTQDNKPERKLFAMSTLYAQDRTMCAGDNKLRVVSGFAMALAKQIPAKTRETMTFVSQDDLNNDHLRAMSLSWADLGEAAQSHGSNGPLHPLRSQGGDLKGGGGAPASSSHTAPADGPHTGTNEESSADASSDDSSSSSAESDEGHHSKSEAVEPLSESDHSALKVHWFALALEEGTVHFTRVTTPGGPVAYCQKSEKVFSTQVGDSGIGVAAALAQPRTFCTACVKRIPRAWSNIINRAE